MSITTIRPPSFVSRKQLAAELDMSESTVDEMVRRGVLPRSIKLSNGCARWSWSAVESALESLASKANDADQDPFMTGARNAAQVASEGGRHPSKRRPQGERKREGLLLLSSRQGD